jgi:hypothetical protein
MTDASESQTRPALPESVTVNSVVNHAAEKLTSSWPHTILESLQYYSNEDCSSSGFLRHTTHWYATCTCSSSSAVLLPTTNDGQLGNLLGALQNWVTLQRDAQPGDEMIFSIVGWHSLTLPQDPKTLSIARRDMLAALLAIGIDPKRSILFHQDEVWELAFDALPSLTKPSVESRSC